MKFSSKILLLTLSLGLIVLSMLIIFSPKPTLLEGIQYSRAFYDHKNHHLLRLTLTDDDKYRLYIPLKDIPKNLIDATLLQEDQYFYRHKGVNPVSLMRATFQTYVLKSRRMGASTITMQLARLRFGLQSRKISGKLMQIYRALQLERHYSKHDILEAYLNLAPYGGNIEGVGAASLVWFNKPVSKITLPQALTLAVIPQNPEARKPPGAQLQSIRNKLYLRWIEKFPRDISWEAAMHLPLSNSGMQKLPFHSPHFVTALAKKLSTSGNQTTNIQTTLDIRLQHMMERTIKQYIARKQSVGVTNGAALLVDSRDLSIKAMVGSANFFDRTISGQINGTDIPRSPGSALKPFIYALALDQGLIHPKTMLKDVPSSFGSYNPENYDKDFVGPISAQEALASSRNIPAIYLANLLNKNNLYALLEKTGVLLKSENWYGLSMALGGAELSMQELTALYAMLANGGTFKPLRMYKDQKQEKGRRLLSPEASYLVIDMLSQTPHEKYAGISIPIAFKTGTSSGHRDAWTAGIFGPYVLTVWVGNFDRSGNPALVGKDMAAPLFFELIHGIRQERGTIPGLAADTKSLNLVKVAICKASGLLPTSFCTDTETTWFIPGKSPIKKDNIYREIAINNTTGLRTCHIDENTRYAIYEFWPSDLLKIFKTAGITRKTPPMFEPGCDRLSSQGMAPQITSPRKDLTYIFRADTNNTNHIPFTAVTDADVVYLHWFINGSFVGKTRRDKPFLWLAKAGSWTIRVVDDHGQADVQSIEVQVEK